MQNPKNPKFKAYWLWLTTLSVQYMHCTRTALCLDGLRQREWNRQERRRPRQERMYISRASRLHQAQYCFQTIQPVFRIPRHDQPTFRFHTQLHLCLHAHLDFKHIEDSHTAASMLAYIASSVVTYLANCPYHPCFYFTIAAQSQGLLDLCKLELMGGPGPQGHEGCQPHLGLHVFFWRVL